jgi:hypothetical protein
MVVDRIWKSKYALLISREDPLSNVFAPRQDINASRLEVEVVTRIQTVSP